MRRADRLLQVIQILRRKRGPVSGSIIAEELEVSLRTIYRDILTLQASGVPVVGEAGVGYALDEGYDLPPLMFTSEELEIVMLGLRMAGASGDAAITRTAEDAAAKIASKLPKALRSHFFDAPLLAPPYGEAPPKDGVALMSIREALRRECKVEILYRIPERTPERRIVWPIVIAFFERARVLAAWCELRQAYRYFRTDRVLDIRILNTPLPRGRKHLYHKWREDEKMDAKLGME